MDKLNMDYYRSTTSAKPYYFATDPEWSAIQIVFTLRGVRDAL